jgi:uncharacterized protein YndB with AHSA1/START domain
MSLQDDPTIERTTDLDMNVDELWALIASAEGWTSWLVDEAEVDIAPDAVGSAVEDGLVRQVRIESVTEGRGIAFSWWNLDDPSSASYVQLDIVELPDGHSQLHISEQFRGSSATARMSSGAAVSWDVRLVTLWLLIVQSAVMA